MIRAARARSRPRPRVSPVAPPPCPRAELATFEELRAHPDLASLADPSAFIHRGYRWRRGGCATTRSICSLHTETANVWTHLGGALVSLSLLLLLLTRGTQAVSGLELAAGATAPPVWPLAVFLCGVSACLGMSATYHLYEPLSRATARLLQRLDYAGISILIFTSNVAPIFYVYYCEMDSALCYIAISLIINCACIVLGLSDKFASEQWRKARAAAYVLSGALGVVPVAHALYIAHWHNDAEKIHTLLRFSQGFLTMGAQYIVGAMLYALRVPERFFPGKLDYFASHSLFHILVVTAAATHWGTIKDVFLWRAGQPSCSPQ